MDQSLDEIIQSKRKNNFNRTKPNNNSPLKRSRITKRNSGPVVVFAKSNPEQWKHDMYRGTNRSNIKPGYKIQISNLDFGVNDEDINELFKEFGTLSRAGVNYDRSGRSLGSAEVVYVNKSSAIQARNKYNGIPLDNKPMKIAIVEGGSAFNRVGAAPPRIAAATQRPIANFGNNGSAFRNARSNPPMRRNGANRTSGGGGGNQRNQQKIVKTKEQLDAEMDEYLSKVPS